MAGRVRRRQGTIRSVGDHQEEFIGSWVRMEWSRECCVHIKLCMYALARSGHGYGGNGAVSCAQKLSKANAHACCRGARLLCYVPLHVLFSHANLYCTHHSMHTFTVRIVMHASMCAENMILHRLKMCFRLRKMHAYAPAQNLLIHLLDVHFCMCKIHASLLSRCIFCTWCTHILSVKYMHH